MGGRIRTSELARFTYVYTYIHTYTWSFVHVYVHMYVESPGLSRLQSPGYPGSEVTVPVQANKGMWEWRHVCMHVCVYSFIHVCMNAYIPMYVLIHTYMAWGHAWMYASSCVCRRVHVRVYGRRRHVTTHSWGYVHARGTKNNIHGRKICAYKRSSKSFAQTRIPLFRSGISTWITYADTYICVCASM
jgi:hypothetical protein